jgi:lipoprotein-anchoring transpeptidase ErfK/SrfK
MPIRKPVLYLTLGGRKALRYGVLVGLVARQFSGQVIVARKAVKPRGRRPET